MWAGESSIRMVPPLGSNTVSRRCIARRRPGRRWPAGPFVQAGEDRDACDLDFWSFDLQGLGNVMPHLARGDDAGDTVRPRHENGPGPRFRCEDFQDATVSGQAHRDRVFLELTRELLDDVAALGHAHGLCSCWQRDNQSGESQSNPFQYGSLLSASCL